MTNFINSVPHPPYPARGRKLDPYPRNRNQFLMSRTLLTPQGDGNIRKYQLERGS